MGKIKRLVRWLIWRDKQSENDRIYMQQLMANVDVVFDAYFAKVERERAQAWQQWTNLLNDEE